MSEGGKCGAPVTSSGGDAVATVVAIPLIIAGLAAVGVAKGVQEGYKFVKRKRAESSETANKLWLSQMNNPAGDYRAALDGLGDSSTLALSNIAIDGVNMVIIFNNLGKMKEVRNYNSGLHISEYSYSDAHTRDSAFVVELPGSKEKIAFARDAGGHYQAFANTTSLDELDKGAHKIVNTFYARDLAYNLSIHWQCENIKFEDTPSAYKYTAEHKGEPLAIEINKKNSQPSFHGIPAGLRPGIEEWLKKFTELRIIHPSDGIALRTKGKIGARSKP